MKSRLVKNLLANAIQLIVNQLFGLGIFYILSTGLNKGDFGQINLVLAILLAVFNILSFGVDQLIIKKIAAGTDLLPILSIYILHVLLTGLGFYGTLLIIRYFFPFNHTYSLLLLIAIGKTMLYFSTPFKQAANGLEKFKLLAYMSVGSNLVRCVGLIIFFFLHRLSLNTVIPLFIGGDLIELLVCIIFFKQTTQTKFKITWNGAAYASLLRESLPQTGVVLITSVLARFDWIFIGIMVSAVKLAEYSFAYKVFEISTLPLLAIAPLLIPWFTKLFRQTDFKVNDLKLLARIEMIIATFTALLLNICWGPAVDSLTSGKYGSINIKTVFILSLCMPLLYVNNFLWTIFFAQGRLKAILVSFLITLLVNVGFNLVLIPFFKNEGAAFAFLLSCIAQTIYYLKLNLVEGVTNVWKPLLFCTISALVAGFGARYFFPEGWLILPTSIVFYITLLFITKQVILSDRRSIAKLFN